MLQLHYWRLWNTWFQERGWNCRQLQILKPFLSGCTKTGLSNYELSLSSTSKKVTLKYTRMWKQNVFLDLILALLRVAISQALGAFCCRARYGETWKSNRWWRKAPPVASNTQHYFITVQNTWTMTSHWCRLQNSECRKRWERKYWEY